MTLEAFREVKYTRCSGYYSTSFIGLVNIRIPFPATWPSANSSLVMIPEPFSELDPELERFLSP